VETSAGKEEAGEENDLGLERCVRAVEQPRKHRI